MIRSIHFAISLCLIGLLTGCSSPPRKALPEQTALHVFNWTDYIGKTTISSFENAHNARVTYDNYSSNEELGAKMQTGQTDFDVVFPSSYEVEILKSKNLLAPLDHARIPNITNVPQQFAHPAFDPQLTYSVPYTWSTTGIGYDSRVVTDQQVQSYSVLFSPQYRGQILMLDDVRASIGMALKSLGYSANSVSATEISKAKERLIAQKPLVHVYTGSNIVQLLASGEVKLAYASSGDILQAAKKNSHIHFMIPNEGAMMYVDYMCIPATSAHKELANQFLNHILDPNVSLEIANTIRYATTNEKAQGLAQGDTRDIWTILSRFPDNSKFEYVKNVGPALKYYNDAWQEIKGGDK
jgi:spermidine/putrescine-binding protein